MDDRTMHDSTAAAPDPSAAPAEPGQVLRAKGLMDGAKTPGEAAALLREEADRIEALGAAGWTFVGPVHDDLGQLVDPEGNAGGEGA